MKIAFYILIVISLVTGSCSNQEPKLDSKNLIPENELISLLIDIHITDGLLEIPGINTAYSVLDSISTYYHVIEKHGYTKEAMDKTMKYYFIKNPKKLNRIYDMALGKLSEMESRIEKESNIEQARLSNLWRGKDFYAVPSVSNIDSTELNITISNHGYYKLTFTTTVYPDDQAVNPRLTIYSVSADSLETGRRSYLKTWGYIKDGAPHTYNLTLNVPVNTNIHFGGSLFDSENRKEGIQNHYKIENISLSYSIVDL
jgi:hypothetical protein